MRVPRDGHTSVVQGEYIIHIGGSGDKVRAFSQDYLYTRFTDHKLEALSYRI